MSSQSNPIIGNRSTIDQLEDVIGEIQAILEILTLPEIKIHPDADIDPIGTAAKAIQAQMQRIENDVNGNPRYVLHFLAFHNDYATAKEIANSLGWSVYRAKSHGGCFVGQSYSTDADAHFIAKARARHAEAKGGAA
jgi:hypothetical protein